jgi:hypothetical protein
VLDLVAEAHGTRLRVHEAEPGALERSPRLQAVVARYRASMPVRIGDAGRPLDPDASVRDLFPDGSERVVAGDRVIERPVAGPARERRLALPLRLVRRARDWVRARRLRGYS